MILQVISIIAPIFLIALFGYIYAAFERPNMQVINRMILQLLVPALVFSVMSAKDFQMAIYADLALAALGVILFSGLAAYILSRLMGFKWTTLVPPMMFFNWGNIGIPLIVFTFGQSALNAAVILFIVGNIVHFTLGITMMRGRFDLKEFFMTPVIIAFFLGLMVNNLELSIPDFVIKPIDMMGQAAIPLMLVSLGVRLQSVRWNDMKIAFVAAIFGPLIGLLAAYGFAHLIDLNDLQTKQLLLFGALPPAVMNYMFAEQYDLEPEKVASIVLLSNLLSVVTYFVLLLYIL